MCVLLFDVCNALFFSNEISRNVKHLLLRKTDALKTFRKSKFLGKKV